MRPDQLTFGKFRLDTSEQTLWKGHKRLALRPKSCAVLEYLVQHAGRLVTTTELFDAAWPDVHVGNDVLKASISQIRRVLGDEADAPRFIETVQRRGYRFIASVGIGNIPAPLTTFIGREREVVEIKCLLMGSRLMTLHGPAGIGKTRLAIRAAADLRDEMPHGVWWVDLGPILDPGAVTQAVAGLVGVRDQAGFALADVLADVLQERRSLFVFDNCEHLAQACAALADKLLRLCPNLKILATSRQPLRAAGEIVWSVPTLSPPSLSTRPDDLLANEAVQLFVACTKVARPDFVMSDRDAAAIAQICWRLDGLPLAIELAAARIRVLAPEEIAARLDDVFALLGQGTRTEVPRHQTLKAAFDWSYDLLSWTERLLFARLSVFAGSFTLAAVESVCGGDGLEPAELLDLMARTIDHSLVRVLYIGETRYRLLYTVRQYAGDKLEPESRAALARRHGECFLFIAATSGPKIHDAEGENHLALLDREYDNLRAALTWARTDQSGHDIGLRIASHLWMYWMRRGRWREGLSWLEEMLERGSGAAVAVRAQALSGVGAIARGQKDLAKARLALEESVALWRTTNEHIELGAALSRLGETIRDLGDLGMAERVTEEAVRLLRLGGAGWSLAIALKRLGDVARLQGRLAAAVALYEESADILRGIPSPWLASKPLGQLAALAAMEGWQDRAASCWRESLVMLAPIEDNWFVSGAVKGMAHIAYGHHDFARAAVLFGAAEALRDTVDGGAAELWPMGSSRLMGEMRTALGETAYDSHFAEGRRLSRAEAISLALAT